MADSATTPTKPPPSKDGTKKTADEAELPLGGTKVKKSKQKHKGLADNTTQEGRSGSVGGVDSGGTGYINALNMYRMKNKSYWKFTKKFRFYTHGWSNSIISVVGDAGTVLYMTSSMAAIPTDLPCMYMSPAEYQMLPSETRVLRTKLKLECLNARTSFQANASNVTTATQNNQMWLHFMKGTEKSGNVIAVLNSGEATHPSKVTAIQSIVNSDQDTLIEKLYGPADPKDLVQLPCIAGLNREWDWYAALGLSTELQGAQTVATNGIIPVGEYFEKLTALNNFNTHMFTFKHNYGGAIITPQSEQMWPILNPSKAGPRTVIWGKEKFSNTGQCTVNADHTIIKNVNDASTYTVWPTDNATVTKDVLYKTSMWRPNVHSFKPGHMDAPEFPPDWLYFGLEAIIGITPSSDTEDIHDYFYLLLLLLHLLWFVFLSHLY